MQADGALKQKLEAYITVMSKFSDAIAKRDVPTVVMAGQGGSGTGSDSEVQALLSMMNAKTAKDLALDFGIKK